MREPHADAAARRLVRVEAVLRGGVGRSGRRAAALTVATAGVARRSGVVPGVVGGTGRGGVGCTPSEGLLPDGTVDVIVVGVVVVHLGSVVVEVVVEVDAGCSCGCGMVEDGEETCTCVRRELGAANVATEPIATNATIAPLIFTPRRRVRARRKPGRSDASASSAPSTSGASADRPARQHAIDVVERIGAHDCGSSASRNVDRAACRWYFTAPSLRPMAWATSATLRSST